MTLDIMHNLISHGRHIYNELCSPSRRPVHLFERNIFHAVAFQEKQNKFRTVRYINDVLSLNNSMLGDYVHRINSIAFEAKDTTYTASYFDQYLKIDGSDRLRIKLYAKEFVMYMQEHSSSTCIWNISLSVDEVCQYLSFLSELLLRMSPIQGIKGYVQVITSNILQSPPGPLIYYACHCHSAVLQSSFMTCHGIFKKSNMTGAIGGYRTAYPPHRLFSPRFFVVFALFNLYFYE